MTNLDTAAKSVETAARAGLRGAIASAPFTACFAAFSAGAAMVIAAILLL